jgi:hypothetical protein
MIEVMVQCVKCARARGNCAKPFNTSTAAWLEDRHQKMAAAMRERVAIAVSSPRSGKYHRGNGNAGGMVRSVKNQMARATAKIRRPSGPAISAPIQPMSEGITQAVGLPTRADAFQDREATANSSKKRQYYRAIDDQRGRGLRFDFGGETNSKCPSCKWDKPTNTKSPRRGWHGRSTLCIELKRHGWTSPYLIMARRF